MSSKLIAIVESSRPSIVEEAARPPWLQKSNELDHLLTGIAWVTAEAQGLSRDNRRKLAQFLFAAGEMVSERTRLEPADQKRFEDHLREVAARRS